VAAALLLLARFPASRNASAPLRQLTPCTGVSVNGLSRASVLASTGASTPEPMRLRAAPPLLVNSEDRDRAVAAGYQMHLAKPVHLGELQEGVATLIADAGGQKPKQASA
jgi:hypothetical protein